MSQCFIINKGSTLPYLRLEVKYDSRYDLRKINQALQSCDVKFTMINKNTGIKKIAKAQAYVVSKTNENDCQEEFAIEYRWKNRDTNESGEFIGSFILHFDTEYIQNNLKLPIGDLIVPIKEELVINIIEGSIKK